MLRSPVRFVRLLRFGPLGLGAMARFLLVVVPTASRALAAIRARAARIPDAALRAQALASIDGKAFHVQGGCILATFLRGRGAARYVRLIAALETIYDYLDNLCDRLPDLTPDAYPTLHEALLDALDDRREPAAYYRDGPAGDDGGYLRSLVDDVRAAARALPRYPAVRERLLDVAGSYVRLQALKHTAAGVREDACARWFAEERERFGDFAWWEFAAACGSSLPVFALLFLAAQPHLEPAAIEATFAAYFPNLSALHILFDYFIDQAEDREHRELNFVACYPSADVAVARMSELIRRSRAQIAGLRDPGRHEFLLRAMCLFYLTHPKVFDQGLDRDSVRILAALDRRPVRGTDVRPGPQRPAHLRAGR